MVEHIKMAGTEFQTSNFMKLNHHKAFLLSVISEMFESKTPPPFSLRKYFLFSCDTRLSN